MDALTSFGPSGAAVAVVILFLKYLKEEGSRRDKREEKFTKAINTSNKLNRDNSKLISETYQFMKNLNGELKKAAQKKLEK